MLQKEVVDRICAPAGNKQYGRLSVMVQYRCQSEALFEVPPHCFRPQPKVTSAFLRLTPRPAYELVGHDQIQLNQVVTRAFSQRRKTLRNSVQGLLSASELTALAIDPNARAETLSVEDFLRLSDYCSERARA